MGYEHQLLRLEWRRCNIVLISKGTADEERYVAMTANFWKKWDDGRFLRFTLDGFCFFFRADNRKFSRELYVAFVTDVERTNAGFSLSIIEVPSTVLGLSAWMYIAAWVFEEIERYHFLLNTFEGLDGVFLVHESAIHDSQIPVI
jgi:hypothetical protein